MPNYLSDESITTSDAFWRVVMREKLMRGRRRTGRSRNCMVDATGKVGGFFVLLKDI